jgi:hypothetical protein
MRWGEFHNHGDTPIAPSELRMVYFMENPNIKWMGTSWGFHVF